MVAVVTFLVLRRHRKKKRQVAKEAASSERECSEISSSHEPTLQPPELHGDHLDHELPLNEIVELEERGDPKELPPHEPQELS